MQCLSLLGATPKCDISIENLANVNYTPSGFQEQMGKSKVFALSVWVPCAGFMLSFIFFVLLNCYPLECQVRFC